MHIGIDTRLYGISHAGIGRYVENLVQSLIQTNQDTHFTLFIPPEVKELRQWPKNSTLIPTTIPHYSVAEQWQFLKLLEKHPVDLMHFPHFNVPVLYKKPFVLTVHDILWHQSRGRQVTTLSGPKYYLKYLGYRFVVAKAIRHAKHIITPSQWVKHQLLDHYHWLESKNISPVYEGIDHVKNQQQKNSKPLVNTQPFDHTTMQPYFLYVGSCYPHKNVHQLIKAIKRLNQSDTKANLIIVSARSVFQKRMQALVKQASIQSHVHFAGAVSDKHLKELYQSAIALVHPSSSEGFGLTGLEAMQQGCPVIAAHAASLPEVYQSAALYIYPPNPIQIAHTLSKIIHDPTLRKRQSAAGPSHAAKYQWSQTAKQTMKIYQSIIQNISGNVIQ